MPKVYEQSLSEGGYLLRGQLVEDWQRRALGCLYGNLSDSVGADSLAHEMRKSVVDSMNYILDDVANFHSDSANFDGAKLMI